MTRISEKIIAALPVPASGNRVHYFSGAALQSKKAPPGFGVRVTSAGTRSFVWFHRVDGQKHLETIGSWSGNEGGGKLSAYEAVVAASERAKEVGRGVVDHRPARTRRLQGVPAEPGRLNVAGLLDQFVARYVKDAKLRSAGQIEDIFNRLVKPSIGQIGIYDLKRSHVTAMLNAIADKNGPVMADRVLAFTRKSFNWYETNGEDDDFKSPIVRGMARSKAKERARRRVLADDEIRDLFDALESVEDVSTWYRRLVPTLLLTAARRNEVSEMHAREIQGDVWTVPAERYKTKISHDIPLTREALAAIGPVGKGFLFSTNGGGKPINDFSKSKVRLDREIATIRKADGREPMGGWVLHDLRRTARSLMSRAGVPSDHAERALGHVIGGIRETYDRHTYLEEKRRAFEALAAQVGRILNPVANVVPLKTA